MGHFIVKPPLPSIPIGVLLSEVRFLQVELRQKLIHTGGAGSKWKDFWKKDPNSLGLDIYCQFQWGTSRKSIPTGEILTRAHP